MKASIKLGRIWGIPIGLHTSWFLVFALITFSLSAGYFPSAYPQLSGTSTLLLGLVTSLLFFGSVLAHELGHACVALREKIPVRGITLFIFGGVAQIGREPQSPGAEFRIAIAGPLTSVGLAALFGGLWLLNRDLAFLAGPSLYLARINLILALFNLIPGFPLDGGRVLRAFVWWWTKSLTQATKVAGISGQVAAFGFIGIGLTNIFTGDVSNGLWLIFIGWFLNNAASSATKQLQVQEKLSGITVAQAMSQNYAEVHGLTSLYQLIHDYVLKGGQHVFFVTDYYGQSRGMLTLQDITKVPQAKWRFITAERIMVPFDRLLSVDPDMELLTALQTLEEANLSQAPVVQQDQPVGLLSREQVLQNLRLRTKLGL